VLRHKLNSLLTVFFVASILLVVINVALTSAMDWSGAVVDAVSNSKSTRLRRRRQRRRVTTRRRPPGPQRATTAVGSG
jgi:hypothetical protein